MDEAPQAMRELLINRNHASNAKKYKDALGLKCKKSPGFHLPNMQCVLPLRLTRLAACFVCHPECRGSEKKPKEVTFTHQHTPSTFMTLSRPCHRFVFITLTDSQALHTEQIVPLFTHRTFEKGRTSTNSSGQTGTCHRMFLKGIACIIPCSLSRIIAGSCGQPLCLFMIEFTHAMGLSLSIFWEMRRHKPARSPAECCPRFDTPTFAYMQGGSVATSPR